jgi:NAD(P)-dependent dehydrogenase (short-subunit alcohol dehydrogenase family)
VTDAAAMRAMVEAIRAACGQVECAFYNAGIAPYQMAFRAGAAIYDFLAGNPPLR